MSENVFFARIAVEEAEVVQISIPFTSLSLARKVRRLFISGAVEFHTVTQSHALEDLFHHRLMACAGPGGRVTFFTSENYLCLF